MRSGNRWFKVVVHLSLVLLLQSVITPGLVSAQAPPCDYDKTNPTIENARKNFKITNYPCAEQELNDVLAIDTLSLEERANAHVLLASVYYAMLRNDKEKSTKVTKHFVEAFKAFRTWKGDLDIRSPEFLAMMEQARELVENQDRAAAMAEEQQAELQASLAAEGKKKPWYKKWWALGGIGAVVVAAVVIAGGGGGDEPGTPPDSDLPGFPGHP